MLSESFDKLIRISKDIEDEINIIQNISNSSIKNFEALKNRKINIERILNTMTAMLELKTI